MSKIKNSTIVKKNDFKIEFIYSCCVQKLQHTIMGSHYGLHLHHEPLNISLKIQFKKLYFLRFQLLYYVV